MRLVAVMVFSVFVIGCKADAAKCEQAARNYATLTFWKKAEDEIAKAPPAKRDGIRKHKLSDFTNELEGKIDLVVSQCQSANNDDQIDCMIAAKTADAAIDCADQVDDH